MWEPGNRVAGVAAGPWLCAAPAQVQSQPLTSKLPSPCSFPFSWLLVWLFIAHLNG